MSLYNVIKVCNLSFDDIHTQNIRVTKSMGEKGICQVRDSYQKITQVWKVQEKNQ